MRHLKLLRKLVLASTVFLSVSVLGCPPEVQNFFEREAIRAQQSLPLQQHRANKFRFTNYNEKPLPPYNGRVTPSEIPFDSRHSILGHMDESSGISKISKGMHSRYGLDELMKANSFVKETLLDASGNIKSKYIDVDPKTGVQTVLIPREGFHKFNGHWRSARDRGGAIRFPDEQGDFVAKNLFPQDWNPTDIEAAARSVYKQNYDGNMPLVNGTYFGVYRGVEVEIQVVNNNINSVFPSWQGAFPEYESLRIRKTQND